MLNRFSKYEKNESVTSLKGSRQNSRNASEEPDLLMNARSEERQESPRKRRRSGLRKRFLSLTEGIASFFSPEKRSRESLSRKGSKESLRSLQQLSASKFSLPEECTLSAEKSIQPFRRHASSFSSFRPQKEVTPEYNHSKNSSFSQKGKSPLLDRLKKAPPSPPPRRYSFWLTPDARGGEVSQNDPLAKAVLSSSFANLPQHLKPPPPPPPVRFCQFSSPRTPNSFRTSSESRPSTISPLNARERSLPSERRLRFQDSEPNFKQSFPSPLALSSSCNGPVTEKTVSLILQKENGTFGFTLRGGMSPDGVARPLLVTHVRPGGPADREGSLKAGDRLVALDGRDMTRYTLSQAQVALQDVENSATLAIRFDISVMDGVRQRGTPLLVEIERTPGSSLGITLNASQPSYNPYSINSNNSNMHSPNSFVIESIRTASIAERCGALAVGDVVCSVDKLRLDQNNLEEVNQILCNGQGQKVTLEVIPNKNASKGSAMSPLSSPICGQRFSIYNTLGLSRTLNQRHLKREPTLSPITGSTLKSSRGVTGGVSHTENIRVTLLIEGRSAGMSLRPSYDGTFPLVASIEPGGAAQKCGVICVGDRIISVNGRNLNGVGMSEVTQMMNNTRPTVILDVEIDITDAVVASSGTFSIKLSKRHCSLGIRVTKGRTSSDHQEEVSLISEIISGSSAHRSGTLQVGDQIIAIDNTKVDALSLDQIRNLFDLDTTFVTLKVQKDDLNADDTNNVTYTVQLQKDNGVLGISAIGSEEPFEPIFIGGIVPGSMAAQTGAIHVGDRLLSIDGISLRGKPLSEAVRLLQGNNDTVTLKVSKPKIAVTGAPQTWAGFHGAPALSVDSAVESLSSGGNDIPPSTSASTSLTIKTDSTPELFRSNCGSTVRRRLTREGSRTNLTSRSEERKSWDCSHSSDSGQSEDRTDWDKMIADLNQISATCGLRDKALFHDANGNVMTSSRFDANHVDSSNIGGSLLKGGEHPPSTEDHEGTYSVSYATALHRASSPATPDSSYSSGISNSQVFTMTLAKDPFYEDFGFSVSDGLYEKGVYVNRIRKGGPAYRSGLLKPYDRILQVNETQTEDFDCCLTVPLIASAEESLFLKVSRSSNTPPFRLVNNLRMNAWLEGEDEEGVNVGSPFNSKIT